MEMEREDERKTALVTAIGSFSAREVIAGCRREGMRVIGCDIYPAEWVADSADVDAFYRAPYATDEMAYRAFLMEVCEKENVDFVLPLTDVEVDVLQKWRVGCARADETKETDETGKSGVMAKFAPLHAVLCMSGIETIRLCRDKERMQNFLSARGLCRTIPGRELSGVVETEAGSGYENLSYPLVIKPVDGRSSQGRARVKNARQMAYAASECVEQGGRFLVQPMIDGSVVTVDVVRDPKSGITAAVARRELLRTLNGAGTSVYVYHDEMLEQECREIAEALGICGCVNFEFIDTQGDGKHRENEDGDGAEPGRDRYCFLECNPRFSGGVAFSCMAGYDMIRAHLACFEGKTPERPVCVENQYIARRYTEYRMK